MTDAHPRMALGTMHFGTRLSATQSGEILDAYLDLGGQWIDTANCYAFWGPRPASVARARPSSASGSLIEVCATR